MTVAQLPPTAIRTEALSKQISEAEAAVQRLESRIAGLTSQIESTPNRRQKNRLTGRVSVASDELKAAQTTLAALRALATARPRAPAPAPAATATLADMIGKVMQNVLEDVFSPEATEPYKFNGPRTKAFPEY